MQRFSKSGVSDIFFLYHRTTRPTGEVLARALGLPHGVHPPADRQDVLIRWGNRERVRYRPGVTVNPMSAIELATNKLASLQYMRVRGVVVPNFSADPRELRAPFLGRAINHTRGTDIRLCMQQRDAVDSDFYVEYVPTDREYRARVVGDQCVRVSEKVLSSPDDYTPWIRNYEHGHTFVSPHTRLNSFQESLAVAAVKAHGLDFGAVDMVVGDDGHTYVLEVNTAPALAPRSASAMLGGLIRLVAERAGVELEPDYTILDELSDLDDTEDGDTEDDTDGLIEF